MKVRIIHESGELACWYGAAAPALPRVGDTISFIGERHDCREVTRVDWGMYVTAEREGSAALEEVRVFVK